LLEGIYPHQRIATAEFRFSRRYFPFHVDEHVVYGSVRILFGSRAANDRDIPVLVEKSGCRVEPTIDDLAVSVDKENIFQGRLILEQSTATGVSSARRGKWSAHVEFDHGNALGATH